MTFVEQVQPEAEAFQWCWSLRKRVLLDPFAISHQDATGDDSAATHFGVFKDGRCLACLMMVPQRSKVVRMRQVAVDEDSRRLGLGRDLVLSAEQNFRERGFQLVVAHAREPAVPFYLALGYHIVGAPFTEVGLPHRVVEKSLEFSTFPSQ